MNQHPLHDYQPPQFTEEQTRFLAAAGWSNMAADELVERAAALLAECPPEIERATYLTRALLAESLFAERRHAYAFAHGYIRLADAGADFRLLVWDWE